MLLENMTEVFDLHDYMKHLRNQNYKYSICRLHTSNVSLHIRREIISAKRYSMFCKPHQTIFEKFGDKRIGRSGPVQ